MNRAAENGETPLRIPIYAKPEGEERKKGAEKNI